jgi:acyl-coenzyme A synthetase/AMP-(fatty) acid ligase
MVLRPDGSRCDPGEPGELVHRGSLVALGYWNDPELTKQRFRPYPAINQGLMDEIVVWSGDLVRADEDGFLYFLGRTDQLLKTSGYRVSPSEIEEVALEIRGVIEAVAVGLPDEALGHRIGLALVVGNDAVRDIVEVVRHHLRQQLPSYMVPASIHVVESIPRNPNGKQDRRALIMQLQSLANPEPAPLATRSCR